jgi:hypothetical protein
MSRLQSNKLFLGDRGRYEMRKEDMKAKTTVQLFIPAAFCAFISVMVLFIGNNAKSAFFAFLPMCFFFAAMPLIAMNKRLTDLEEKLKQANGEGS